MKRNCSLNEISDGNLYSVNDLVTVNCNGCKGAASCCHGMGNSIILDPYDIYRLTTNLNITFEQLLADKIELGMVDGIILPNLKMTGESEGCAFLNADGRCSIHALRPGICRIFPLGRVYDNHTFRYFLQTNECNNTTSTKVKVSKWIDTTEVSKNEQYLIDWHYYLNDVEGIIKSANDDKLIKDLNMYVLNTFYIKKYDVNVDFYTQMQERLAGAKRVLVLLKE